MRKVKRGPKRGGFAERRKAQRLNIPIEVKYKLLPRKKIARETFCHDISGTGLRLKLESPLTKGDKVKTFLYFPKDSTPVTADSRVVWCRKSGASEKAARYEAGMEYVKIIPRDRERFVHLFCEAMLNYFLGYGGKGKAGWKK